MMKQGPNKQQQSFWPRTVIQKWFNKDTEYSADPDDEDDIYTDSDTEEFSQSPRRSRPNDNNAEDSEVDDNDDFPRLRRRKSETFRAQYINSKDLKICVGTWNVGGKIPPDDIDIDDWLDIRIPADIYVIGLQEIVPLNAGNILGSEDTRPVQKWENIIRETLNRARPVMTKVKSYSDPPSPSRFKPSDDVPDIDEVMLETDSSDPEEGIYPIDEEPNDEFKNRQMQGENNNFTDSGSYFQRQFSSPKKLDRLNCFRTGDDDTEQEEASTPQINGKLTRMLSGTERIGLCWPEPSLALLPQNLLERPNSFKSIRSFKSSKSFRTYSSFKSVSNSIQEETSMLAEIDLESLMNRKRRSPFVKIVSKKMVGIFLTVWARRSLRRHVQNVKVSTVGVGVMGYIGNKGSISVSMSIYQTLFCFICTHLTSGEKYGDEVKRNSDVREIHRRTHFHPASSIGLPKSINDHEKIIWFGDLNYRINLSYEKTRELISRKGWSELQESDQLMRELRKGRAFDGWSEGTLNFPPTYKYEINSGKYYGEDPKIGRRTPAWCDRILSYGKGLRQLSYRRTELWLSDHRPVTATFMAEVEVFCARKLQKALTFTDAEIENEEVVADMCTDVGMSRLRFGEDASEWER